MIEDVMKKKTVIFVLLFVILAGGVGSTVWYTYYQDKSEKRPALILYGNVDIREVNLAFNGQERIAKIRVKEGQMVKKGEFLATLETRRLSLYVDQIQSRIESLEYVIAKMEAGTRDEEIKKARADVEAIRVRVRNAGKTYERLRPLSKKALVSQDRADDAKALLDAEKATLKAAKESLALALAGPRKEDIAAKKAEWKAMKASLDIARQNLADASLYAPNRGIIRNRILEEGDMASPRRPVLTLALTDPVWVRTYVSETDLGKIFPGMNAMIQTDSHPDKKYEGWVGYISPTAEFTPKSVQTPDIRTQLVYQVRVFAKNPNMELRLGMPATVIIPLNQPKPETGQPKHDKPAVIGKREKREER